MIVDTNHPSYFYKHEAMVTGKYNGAFYYAKEIEDIIIPRIITNRNWVTINIEGECYDHSIVFIHSNVELDKKYGWLSNFNDLILVCSNYETQKHMSKYGHSIFLPLSVDVDFVKQFAVEKKTEKACYAGNMWSFKNEDLMEYVPKETHCFINMPREELLREMANYEECYAVGRTAIEAKILGCKLKVCDHRYPDVNFWQIVDSKEAAVLLQAKIDEIDKSSKCVC